MYACVTLKFCPQSAKNLFRSVEIRQLRESEKDFKVSRVFFQKKWGTSSAAQTLSTGHAWNSDLSKKNWSIYRQQRRIASCPNTDKKKKKNRQSRGIRKDHSKPVCSLVCWLQFIFIDLGFFFFFALTSVKVSRSRRRAGPEINFRQSTRRKLGRVTVKSTNGGL